MSPKKTTDGGYVQKEQEEQPEVPEEEAEQSEEEEAEQADEEVDALAQLMMAQDLLGTVSLSSDANLTEIHNALLDKINEMEDIKKAVEVEQGIRQKAQKEATRKAEVATAKAIKDKENKDKRSGREWFKIVTPSGRVLTLFLDKSKTLGRLRKKAVRACKEFDMGSGKKKKKWNSICLVLPSGKNLTAKSGRPFLYNQNELLNQRALFIMWEENFNTGNYPQPLNLQVSMDHEEDDENTDDETDSDDDE